MNAPTYIAGLCHLRFSFFSEYNAVLRRCGLFVPNQVIGQVIRNRAFSSVG